MSVPPVLNSEWICHTDTHGDSMSIMPEGVKAKLLVSLKSILQREIMLSLLERHVKHIHVPGNPRPQANLYEDIVYSWRNHHSRLVFWGRGIHQGNSIELVSSSGHQHILHYVNQAVFEVFLWEMLFDFAVLHVISKKTIYFIVQIFGFVNIQYKNLWRNLTNTMFPFAINIWTLWSFHIYPIETNRSQVCFSWNWIALTDGFSFSASKICLIILLRIHCQNRHMRSF